MFINLKSGLLENTNTGTLEHWNIIKDLKFRVILCMGNNWGIIGHGQEPQTWF